MDNIQKLQNLMTNQLKINIQPKIILISNQNLFY